VAIEDSFAFIDQSVVIIDSHRIVIVRNRKDEDFSMKLLFALYSSIELDDAPYDNSYAMSVLSISDVKRCSIALHFAREEREVHS